MQGTVKFFDIQKGFGFVKPDDGGKDVFLASTALRAAGFESLVEGQRIEFNAVPSKNGKGDQAQGIRLV